MHMSNIDKLVFLFTENKIIPRCAETCANILNIRKSVTCETETVFK